MNINNVSGVRSDIAEMLSKMREISNKSKVFADEASGGKATGSVNGFDNAMSMVKNAFETVNNVQVDAEAAKKSYLSGDGNVSMAQVVVASQKSKLAFEGLVTVRNKILEAYKEIMNMAV